MPKSEAWKEGAFAGLGGRESSDNPYLSWGSWRDYVIDDTGRDPADPKKEREWEEGRGWAMGKLDDLRDEIRRA